MGEDRVLGDNAARPVGATVSESLGERNGAGPERGHIGAVGVSPEYSAHGLELTMLTTLLRLAQHESITTATFYAQLAVALYPQSEPALFQLATLLVQQGQTPHAVYLLTTPDHAPTHSASTRAALLYAQHLQPHLALNHLQQLLPLPPTEPLPPPFPSDHATLQLATLNLKLDQPFQAIQLFTSLLHQDHLHWEAMHQLAKLGQPPNLDQLFPISVHDNSLKPIIPLFTPVQPPIPRGKRARTPRANAPPPVIEQPSVPTKRAVKGVPVQPRSLVTPVQSTSSLPAAVGAAQVRRSTRLSRELSASYEANTPAAPPPRKAVAGSSSILPPTSSRITKRSKSGQGPTVLSDTGTPSLTDALSPRSRLSSSPAPSSPARPSSDAERYLNDIVRSFAKAEIAAAAYESRKTLDALNELPIKVQRAERAMMMRGRAHFELLEYDKVRPPFPCIPLFILTSSGGGHLCGTKGLRPLPDDVPFPLLDAPLAPPQAPHPLLPCPIDHDLAPSRSLSLDRLGERFFPSGGPRFGA